MWISAAYAGQNDSIIHVVANLSVGREVPFVIPFVVPSDGVTYTQLGFTFGGLPPRSTLTLTDVLATSNSSIRACQAAAQTTNTFTEAPSSVDTGAPLRECIFTEAQQAFYNAPAIGQCFCDKDSGGAACDEPALPLPFTPGRTILKASCGGFATSVGLALARDGSLQPVNSDGTYVDGDAPLQECKCRDLGLVMRSTFLESSPFSDSNVYRVDAAYGQPEFVDNIINNTATNQVSPTILASDAAGRQHLRQQGRHAALHRGAAGRRELARDVAGRAGRQRARAGVARRLPVGPEPVRHGADAHHALPQHDHLRHRQLQQPGLRAGMLSLDASLTP
jgi:hypothetical protein